VDKVALEKRFLGIPYFPLVSVIQFDLYDYYPSISNTIYIYIYIYIYIFKHTQLITSLNNRRKIYFVNSRNKIKKILNVKTFNFIFGM